MELSPPATRVSSRNPQFMMTDMMQGLQVKQPQLVQQFDKEALFGLIGYPKEQKGRILFLCSKAVGWCAGQDMLIDGGASLWKHPASFD